MWDPREDIYIQELAARIEALEAAQQLAPAPPAPAGELVEQVAKALYDDRYSHPGSRPEARAALAAPEPVPEEGEWWSPPSLTEVALQMLGTIERDAHYLPEITDTIRRALEARPERSTSTLTKAASAP